MISEEYAYLLGALRDACVYMPEYELKFVQKNPRWLADCVNPFIHRTFNARTKIRRRGDGLYELKLNSKQVVEKLVEDAKVDVKPNDTPPIIVNQPISQQLWYVAGFYDAEGDKKGSRFRIWQSWEDVNMCPPLEFVKEVLGEVGIESKLYRLGLRKSKLFEFCLEVTRSPEANLTRFLEKIPLQHPETVLRAPRKFRRA